MKAPSLPLTLLTALIFFVAGTLSAQTPKKSRAEKDAEQQTALKNAIENRRYYFQEENSSLKTVPNNPHLNPYSLDLQGDTLYTDLPYFSQAYESQVITAQKRVRFTTTDFNYTVKPGKKDGWEVKITPNNQTRTARIILRISSTGYATANIKGQFQENVNYYGTVTAD